MTLYYSSTCIYWAVYCQQDSGWSEIGSIKQNFYLCHCEAEIETECSIGLRSRISNTSRSGYFRGCGIGRGMGLVDLSRDETRWGGVSRDVKFIVVEKLVFMMRKKWVW